MIYCMYSTCTCLTVVPACLPQGVQQEVPCLWRLQGGPSWGKDPGPRQGLEEVLRQRGGGLQEGCRIQDPFWEVFPKFAHMGGPPIMQHVKNILKYFSKFVSASCSCLGPQTTTLCQTRQSRRVRRVAEAGWMMSMPNRCPYMWIECNIGTCSNDSIRQSLMKLVSPLLKWDRSMNAKGSSFAFLLVHSVVLLGV